MEHLKAYEKLDGWPRLKFWDHVKKTLPEETVNLLVDLEQQTGCFFKLQKEEEEEEREKTFDDMSEISAWFGDSDHDRDIQIILEESRPKAIKEIAKEFDCPEQYLLTALEDYKYDGWLKVDFGIISKDKKYLISLGKKISDYEIVTILRFINSKRERISFVTTDNDWFIHQNNQ